MNFAHVHLVLTHFPPVLSVAAVVAATAATLFQSRRRELVQLALLFIVVTGAMMPAIYVAGLRTADVIGKVDGVQQEAIGPHQQAAVIALSVSMATALIAVSLFIAERRRPGLTPTLRLFIVFVATVLATSIGWTAALGGAIHHPEVHA
jgi:hypothetical protein